MPTVLHLLKAEAPLALDVIARQLAAGDTVSVGLLEGAPEVPLPDGVTVRRVPDEVSYDALLDLIYAADQVITW
ncbi:MAG: hypothetical protein HY294_14365 [Candidatus Rokubacteria bacterium]|nr:hypothetical protein [Candidatus Rokubacteria bacterium]MBI3827172.1 hypothetical protein [Candidatus Rokubacteria bacterium]